jgi:hypothetical protein
MGARWTQMLLWTAGGLIVLAALASGAYAYLHKDVFTAHQTSTAASTPTHSSDPTKVGRMVLQAQFSGPLKDTVVQRWKDPTTGDACYIYLPIVVQHSPPTPTGFVQYGANGIGSISCLK